MRWPWRKQPPTHVEISHVEQCLAEAYPRGSEEDKLRTLICSVRRCYRGDGHQQQAIAQRARISEAKTSYVLTGAFTEVRWDTIEAVLIALNARPADIIVALSLYEKTWQDTAPTPDGAEPPHQSLSRTATPWPWPGPQPAAPHAPAHEQADQAEPQAPQDTTSPPAEPVAAVGAPPSSGNGTDRVADPMSATTAAEFVTQMKVFRASKGNPSYREMEKTCEKSGLGVRRYASASFSTIGKNGRLPKEELVRSYIAGAGGDQDELELWEKAWKHLAARLEADGTP